MQLTAQAVLASIVISGALAAPLPQRKWPGQTGFDKDGKPKAVGGTQFLADNGAKIGGGLAIAGALGGIAGGAITAGNNRRDIEVELSERNSLGRTNTASGRIEGNTAGGPHPTPLDIKTPKPDKNGAINAGIGAIGAGIGAVGAGLGIANAINGRDVEAELERRLTPANLALTALMGSGAEVNHADGNQQTWQSGGKSSGASSRRDIDEYLARRLINVGSNHQDQNVQGGGSGPASSGSKSGSSGDANHQDINQQGGQSGPKESGSKSGSSGDAFWQSNAIGNQANAAPQRRLFGVTSTHIDTNDQEWYSGAKTSGASSRRSVDADLLGKRLFGGFGVTSNHIDTNQQEWVSGGKSSGASSRRDLGKRLFGVTSNHVDTNLQQWTSGPKSSRQALARVHTAAGRRVADLPDVSSSNDSGPEESPIKLARMSDGWVVHVHGEQRCAWIRVIGPHGKNSMSARLLTAACLLCQQTSSHARSAQACSGSFGSPPRLDAVRAAWLVKVHHSNSSKREHMDSRLLLPTLVSEYPHLNAQARLRTVAFMRTSPRFALGGIVSRVKSDGSWYPALLAEIQSARRARLAAASSVLCTPTAAWAEKVQTSVATRAGRQTERVAEDYTSCNTELRRRSRRLQAGTQDIMRQDEPEKRGPVAAAKRERPAKGNEIANSGRSQHHACMHTRGRLGDGSVAAVPICLLAIVGSLYTSEQRRRRKRAPKTPFCMRAIAWVKRMDQSNSWADAPVEVHSWDLHGCADFGWQRQQIMQRARMNAPAPSLA
ncbi:hypothetical protein IE81DRAFT_328491 [Ceraceosorus guamensis]|uniref:Uncharacterized protein n=1 Tax=Ceraceosorus guamensis TaxID=1522189 RepID=A0A316W5B3_9BASI|nr:hypothetical protein IE81DRAFT_328491 [Ceraceosorus guamensis]PWN44922.1 hypothetical protein IE81DRAFT_328491 [Ceraceosorus guamensis]